MTIELSIFDTKGAAEKGAWLHLTNPETGFLMYADADEDEPQKPMRIKLLGANSDQFERIKMSARRKAQKRKNEKLNDKQELDRAVLDIATMYAKMTIETENVNPKGGDFTRDELISVYSNYLDIRKQIGLFIGSDANFTQS